MPLLLLVTSSKSLLGSMSLLPVDSLSASQLEQMQHLRWHCHLQILPFFLHAVRHLTACDVLASPRPQNHPMPNQSDTAFRYTVAHAQQV